MTPLARLIAEEIAAEGPMTVARFMDLALAHPALGYYRTRDPFGAAGDFTTAPEISQMFGEMLGLWAADLWSRMGAPDRVLLAEIGPGRGTLMADALRAARVLPGFARGLEVHLVETSPVLREAQRRALAASGHEATWHERFEALPPGPLILFANELFDALPILQFERRDGAWHERRIGLDGAGRLAWRLAPDAEPRPPVPASLGEAPEGAIFEAAPACERLAAAIAGRIASDGGAALIVDYGHAEPGFGDTFQALSRHARADPLKNPGEADLTSHVDFAALAAAASAAGARVFGPAGMGPFLMALGIGERASRLTAAAPDAARDIEAGLARLTGPGQMGSLFKVLVVAAPGGPVPAPFA